jgi:hypothetical protein
MFLLADILFLLVDIMFLLEDIMFLLVDIMCSTSGYVFTSGYNVFRGNVKREPPKIFSLRPSLLFLRLVTTSFVRKVLRLI